MIVFCPIDRSIEGSEIWLLDKIFFTISGHRPKFDISIFRATCKYFLIFKIIWFPHHLPNLSAMGLKTMNLFQFELLCKFPKLYVFIWRTTHKQGLFIFFVWWKLLIIFVHPLVFLWFVDLKLPTKGIHWFFVSIYLR